MHVSDGACKGVCVYDCLCVLLHMIGLFVTVDVFVDDVDVKYVEHMQGSCHLFCNHVRPDSVRITNMVDVWWLCIVSVVDFVYVVCVLCVVCAHVHVSAHIVCTDARLTFCFS